MRLVRYASSEVGIFGELQNDDGKHLYYTLEHAYFLDGNYVPKIPIGTYKCVRGQHQLEHMTEPFTTYEITGIDGHSKILFHWGNYNADSSGCVLVGLDHTAEMITNSKEAFNEFMQYMGTVQEFNLQVS